MFFHCLFKDLLANLVTVLHICLIGWLVCFLCIQSKENHIQKVTTKRPYKGIISEYNNVMDLWKKGFEERIIIQLGRNSQKTLRPYHQVPEAASNRIFQKQRNKKPTLCKKKIGGGVQNLKNHWPLVWRFVKLVKCICEMHKETTRKT